MTSRHEEWKAAQVWERAWWLGNPWHYQSEIEKSEAVAQLLMIGDVSGKRVLDIGCGPLSLLLRHPAKEAVALDPIDYGTELEAAYAKAGIQRIIGKGEDFDGSGFDEVWIYNCLQHVEDPRAVLLAARRASCGIVRVFEWVDIPPYQGHLHTITATLIAGAFAVPGVVPHLFAEGRLGTPDLQGRFVSAIYEVSGVP